MNLRVGGSDPFSFFLSSLSFFLSSLSSLLSLSLGFHRGAADAEQWHPLFSRSRSPPPSQPSLVKISRHRHHCRVPPPVSEGGSSRIDLRDGMRIRSPDPSHLPTILLPPPVHGNTHGLFRFGDPSRFGDGLPLVAVRWVQLLRLRIRGWVALLDLRPSPLDACELLHQVHGTKCCGIEAGESSREAKKEANGGGAKNEGNAHRGRRGRRHRSR